MPYTKFMEPQEPQVIVNQPENSKEESGLFNRLKKRKKLVIVLLLIILAWLGLYLVAFLVDKPEEEQHPPTSGGENRLEPDFSVDDLEWVEHESSSDVFFTYPKEAIVKITSLGTEIRYFGPEEVVGSEHYDSVYLIINTYSKEGLPLETIVRQKFDNYDASETLQGITPVSVNGKAGYYFVTPEAKYIYLDEGDNFILVVDASKDPANLGYSEIVERILASLK